MLTPFLNIWCTTCNLPRLNNKVVVVVLLVNVRHRLIVHRGLVPVLNLVPAFFVFVNNCSLFFFLCFNTVLEEVCG